MADSGKELGSLFEVELMKRRIESLEDIDDVKKVAMHLMEHNWMLTAQLRKWAANDPEKALKLL